MKQLQILNTETLKQFIIESNEQNHIEFLNKNLAVLNDINAENIQNISRVNMVAFALCTSGECSIMLNFREFHIQKNCLFFYQPNQFLQIINQSANCKGKILFIANEVIEDSLIKIANMLNLFFFVNENPCIKLEEKQKNMIMNYIDLTLQKLNELENLFYSEISQNLLKALFFEVCNVYSQHLLVKKEISKTRQDFIFEKFLQELMAHHKEERSIRFYAQKIGISPKYLSSLCKKISGKYASEWIDNFVIAEAKILINNSDMSIKQISNELNFPNQSFFGKYFSKHTGLSPKNYRNRTHFMQ